MSGKYPKDNDEILKKELYFLIPFHIFAYEKELEKINDSPERIEDLLQVYKRFAETLQQKGTEGLSIGRAEGFVEGMITLVRDGLLNLEEGAGRANMTQEEFAQKVKDA